jgi:hypothetical protein
MSDGREERDEQERRRAEEERKDRQDDIERFPLGQWIDQWTPERTDS